MKRQKLLFAVCLIILVIIVVTSALFVSYEILGLPPLAIWSKLGAQPTSSSSHGGNKISNQTCGGSGETIIQVKNGSIERVYMFVAVSRGSASLATYVCSLILILPSLMKQFYDGLNDSLQLFGVTLEKIKYEIQLKLSEAENSIRKMGLATITKFFLG